MGERRINKNDRVRHIDGREGVVVQLYLFQGKAKVEWDNGGDSTVYEATLDRSGK